MFEQLTIDELMEMQHSLQSKYKGIWEPICPEQAPFKLLWMMEEVGEVIALIKKKVARRADCPVVTNPGLRAHFMEEMADVLMYFTDVLSCYGVTAEEFSAAYRAKYKLNMERDFLKEHAAYLSSRQTEEGELNP